MQDECELRFDIPLSTQGTPRQFEQGWRAELAAQGLTSLAMPPAHALSARFRLCGPAFSDPALVRYLPARLAALPGAPAVAAEPADILMEWQGVKIWLSYSSRDLPKLLHRAKSKSRSPQKSARGRCS